MPSDPTANHDRVPELIDSAKKFLDSAERNNHDRMSLWQAYVAIEHAILDLKLKYDLEPLHEKKEAKITRMRLDENKIGDMTRSVRAKLGSINTDSGDKREILGQLRSCRDILKAIVSKL